MRSTMLAGALAALALAAPPAHAAIEPLPDLDQAAPSDVSVTATSPPFRLGFASAVENVGQGPLIIRGHRPDTTQQDMTADQVVKLDDATETTYPDVGTLRFVDSEDHSHWHLLGFERYELRRASDNALVVPDAKTGFCLGDRYQVQGYSSAAVYTGNCGPDDPNLLSVEEGISVGWGDDYSAYLEGQHLDITGVAAGPYYLVHRVDPDGELKETDTSNNAASLRIRIDWPNGTGSKPVVQVLESCPDAATCPGPPGSPPPAPQTDGNTTPPPSGNDTGGDPPPPDETVAFVSRLSAIRWARRAVRRELDYRPRGLRSACRRKSDTRFRCRARWRHRRHGHRARVGVWHSADDGWEYRLGRIRFV